MNHLLSGNPGPSVNSGRQFGAMQYEMVPEPERSCDVMPSEVPALH